MTGKKEENEPGTRGGDFLITAKLAGERCSDTVVAKQGGTRTDPWVSVEGPF